MTICNCGKCRLCTSSKKFPLKPKNKPSPSDAQTSQGLGKNCPKCPECKSHRIIIDLDAINPYECLNCNYSWGSQNIEGDGVTSERRGS